LHPIGARGADRSIAVAVITLDSDTHTPREPPYRFALNRVRSDYNIDAISSPTS